MCKTMCKGGKCMSACAAQWLVLVGAINWGLIGVGYFVGGSDWNVVRMIFGSIEWLEALVYIIVGASAVVSIVGCRCSMCKGGACATGGCCKSAEGEKEEGCCGGSCGCEEKK
jgi:uncharacterized membrane protein YuzA (DUF378 family)